jgi:hypothetical protein
MGMNHTPTKSAPLGFSRWIAGTLLGVASWIVPLAWGQAPSPPAPLDKGIVNGQAPAPAPAPTPADSGAAAVAPDAAVQPASCSTCGSGLSGGIGGCSSCGSGGACVPGHTNEYCDGNCGWCGNTFLGRSLAGLYQCICCPDPCYEGKWLPVADSAFFVDAARPVTQTRIRYDDGVSLQHPDRAEYIWAQETVKGPGTVTDKVDRQTLSLYQEAAAGGFSAFIEMPYEAFDDFEPNPAKHVSGFADLIVGTKAMFLDCELLQGTFEFKTYIPTGNFTTGLGTGHVSLEPSLLFDLRISSEMYSQAQFSYWIPIGGDNGAQGSIYHTHLSLNRTLWHPTPGIQVVGTAELNQWSVLGGEYTTLASDGVTKLVVSARDTQIVSMGPGLRLFVCGKLDIGVGAAFSLTGDRWDEELIRAEFRFRY